MLKTLSLTKFNAEGNNLKSYKSSSQNNSPNRLFLPVIYLPKGRYKTPLWSLLTSIKIDGF